MQYIERTIIGADGSEARFIGYVADNSPEMDPTRQRTSLLILPGGAYAMTSDRESEPVALRFLGKGFNVFVLRYSTRPSRYPVALLESAEAMRLIREHANEWHVNPRAIAVLGFSAGGHLAANLATSAGDATMRAHEFDPDAVRPNALMLAYPVITTGECAHRGSFQCLLGSNAHNRQLLDELAIEQHIDAKTPPVFVWHTMTDTTVPVENALMLIQACRAAGVSVEAHLYPEGSHGLSLADEETAGAGKYAHVVECVQSWPDLAEAWLRRLF
ncbi:acetyl esterase family enzyme [Bifidobacterium saguini DSM 23967]|uniref:Acetyl esterase family enzyme n=2 Tax=Bifidobacterium saguini TaxID=762210 RepID=A0A087DFY0_9BIFI|nr:alpha/beta hydrolase [Bifidobacterium saguini]KFI94430.1 acetyl esterase family enzyme [Bifidobacterium saguini DSM 23967]QTB89998.1 alpha/beta hydrolase [Bifidobacterium saguini]